MTQSEYDGLKCICEYWKGKEENWMESIKFQYTQMQIAGENKKYSIDVVKGA